MVWNTVGMCGVLALMCACIALTVFFIIHRNKHIVGYHRFEKHKEEECEAWMREKYACDHFSDSASGGAT